MDDLTIESALLKGTEFLKSLGISAARLEMELILAASLGLDRLHLYLSLKNPLPPEAREKSRALLTRRKNREPLAYILGHKEFYGLRFEVSTAVLIPRPESEILVDRAIKWSVEWIERNGSALMCDIGTGSGAIAVACAHEQKKRGLDVKWIATDISEEALEIAQANARAHDVEDCIEFRPGEFFEPLTSTVDCICSNPPYVPEGDESTLQPEITKWEPKLALYSGPEGLEHIRTMITTAPKFLSPGGTLFLEIGYNQHAQVEQLIRQSSALEFVAIHPDLAQIPRIAEAKKQIW